MQISLTILYGMIAATTAQAQAVVFQCGTIPDVCENMCWGERCTATQASLATLHYDKPVPATKGQRRTMAGCGSYNRCSNNAKAKSRWPQPNYSCDEFPFATSVEGGSNILPHVNRCVPNRENSSQGGQLQKFYGRACPNAAPNAPCSFNVAYQYGTAGTVPPTTSFCSATAQKFAGICVNTAKFSASRVLMPNIAVQNDVVHLGSGIVAGAPASWKRTDGAGSDSDTSRTSGSSKTSKTTVSSTGGDTSGHQYKLEDGNTIWSFGPLKTGTMTYTMKYKTGCEIKEYAEYEGEASEETREKIDEANAACFDISESKIASEEP